MDDEPHRTERCVDPAARDLVERIAQTQRVLASVRAAQLHDVAALAAQLDVGRRPGEGVDVAASELAPRLRITLNAAYRLVGLALTLTTRLPHTYAALASGAIDEQRARAVADETVLLDDIGAAVVDEALIEDPQKLRRPETLTPTELKDLVRAEVLAVDRDAVRKRARHATAMRDVRYDALRDGMATLTLHGPATDLRPAFDKIEAARRERRRRGSGVDRHAAFVHGEGGQGGMPVGPDGKPVDRRGADAQRYDTALDLLLQPLSDCPTAGRGWGPQLFMTFAAAVGADDEPAQLDGHGSIPAEMARPLFADHRFRRVLTDPFTGHLVSVDGHSYPPGTVPDLGRAEDGEPDGPDPRDEDGEGHDPGGGPHDSGGPGPGGPGGSGGPRRPLSDPPRVPGTPTSTPTPTPLPARSTAVPRPPGPPAPPPPSAPAAVPEQPTAHAGTDARTADARRRQRRLRGDPCPVAAAGGGDYEIPAPIDRFVRARSRRCTAPGCRVPARRCDVDHRIPWPEGPTCPCNLAPKCRRHHLAKHQFGWSVTKVSTDPADPSEWWTSPLGFRYLSPTEPVLPRTYGTALLRDRGSPAECAWPPPPSVPVRYPVTDHGARSVIRADGADRADRADREVARSRDEAGAAAQRWRAAQDDDPPF